MRTILPCVVLALAIPVLAQHDPCQVQRFAPEPGYGWGFVTQVTVNDRHLLISDPGAPTLCPGGGDPYDCAAGAIYAYTREDDRWAFVEMILPPDAQFNEGFGMVQLDGERMIIVTPKHRVGGVRGVVYEYAFDADQRRWFEVDRFGPGVVASPEDGFGVPALFEDHLLLKHGDRVHLYHDGDEGWELQQVIEPPDYATSQFGVAIKLDRDWAILSDTADSSLADRHGSTHVYRRRPDGTLEYSQRLLPPDLSIEPTPRALGFGRGMDFDGRTLAIGCMGADRDYENQGVVYLYEFEDGQWVLQGEITHTTTAKPVGLGFGIELAIDGDRMVTATVWPSHNVVIAFQRDAGGEWYEVAQLTADHASPVGRAYRLGRSVDIYGDHVVAGAPEETVASGLIGAAYAFDFGCEACHERIDLDADGALTIYDFLTFLNLFQDGDALADFDGDGELTIFDFLAFGAAFDAGCD